MRKRVLAFGNGREDRGVSIIPLLPPTGGKRMSEADCDSAAHTVVEVCKIWESHLRTVGIAVIARIQLCLFLRQTIIVLVVRVAEAGRGRHALVVMKGDGLG